MTDSDEDLRPLVAAQYLALADLLDALPSHRWDSASLCEGWRVREVVAHLTMPAHYDEAAFMAELRDCEFDFTRLSNRVATRDAQLPEEKLVADLRAESLHRWVPPGGGFHGALSHVVIHGLDITVPLGEPRRCPDATIRIVLDDLAGGSHAHFGVDISGRSLRATDIDWTYGSGPEHRDSVEHLVLALCGRKVPGHSLDTLGPESAAGGGGLEPPTSGSKVKRAG
jgi:uncharacterized protein (TIGR03083 family)